MPNKSREIHINLQQECQSQDTNFREIIWMIENLFVILQHILQNYNYFMTYDSDINIVVERPDVLECDVVRFQNNKEKWVAFVGLLNGRPYEIFTGIQDDEEGIVLPKNVVNGKIIRQTNPDGTHRYDFQFENRKGYKTTV